MDLVIELLSRAQGHWPLMVITLVLAFIGQIAKGAVFTKERIEHYWIMAHTGDKPKSALVLNKFYWWGRKTLPMHPVLAGAALAFVPGIPVGPGIEGTATRVVYFMGGGILSTWAFDLLKGFAKQHGLSLRLPGESSSPPPPPSGERTTVDETRK